MTIVFLSCLNSTAQEKLAAIAEVNLRGKILFLGDSITHAGHFVAMMDSVLSQNDDSVITELINLGLPSETVTGLSEPAHPWPRPNVHERLDRALEIIEPDVVFACYGMNDGIYHPFSEQRFDKYQQGINKLIDKVKQSGAELILMTPPPFDPLPLRAKGQLKPAGAKDFSWMAIYEKYDSEVIARYGQWILEQRDKVDGVIDLRPAIVEELASRRRKDPSFTYSHDGVHADANGHRIMAKTILAHFGADPEKVDQLDAEDYAAFHRRQQLLHYAWLSHVGHKRPSTKVGMPLEIARIAVDFPESEIPVELFNHSDLKGWVGEEEIWSVENGVIVGRNESVVPSSTYLFTNRPFREFRLLFEVKQTVSERHSKMHSAVAALGERMTDKGGNEFGFRGPLLMFCHDWGIWDAHRRNRIEPPDQKGPLRIESEKVGEWNRCEILVIGNRIRFVANGELVFDFTDEPNMLQASPIGLQLHANKRPQEYRFRGLVISQNPENTLVTLDEDRGN